MIKCDSCANRYDPHILMMLCEGCYNDAIDSYSKAGELFERDRWLVAIKAVDKDSAYANLLPAIQAKYDNPKRD